MRHAFNQLDLSCAQASHGLSLTRTHPPTSVLYLSTQVVLVPQLRAAAEEAFTAQVTTASDCSSYTMQQHQQQRM
jgi:hypothetical protein